ncbi:Acetylornithine deacetylase [Hondaea fermentalgiana]|uniref:Acetylornithine deacetylase n=1 Tax=Hondaea fermentalgiana TaxID=2315210 RepID=A0A2R5G8N0_9STRA|nr:Acetylornithine deacetylase [Hondaea fermentalgiana]|eukprot:GBG26138.1 Acetylornithine deacetylase [Hondaea fermentalgiana]
MTSEAQGPQTAALAAFAAVAAAAAAAVVLRRKNSTAKSSAGGSSSAKADSVDEQLKKLYSSTPAIPEAQDTFNLRLDEARFVDFLGRLLDESEHLQNFPPEFIPKEDLVVKHVLDILNLHSTENGGPLEIEQVSFTPGRSNLIIRYPSTAADSKDAPTIGLIGSHMDVVPAVKENWKRDPFHLQVEGDMMYGRGTTDCLGHIALLTLFFEALAKKRPETHANIVAVFICSEEATDKPGIGVDGLEPKGYLKALQNGTSLWIDASDSEPCIGTAGALQWHLKATGKRFHSGFPNLAVNPIELLTEASAYLQDKFYAKYAPHPEEKRFGYLNPSTIKPTQISAAKGGLNQIPPTATFSGDIRLTPFYDCAEVIESMNTWVKELNETRFAALGTRGPVSKYELPDEDLIGKLELEWAHDGEEILMEGIACNIDSPGFLAICDSIKSVRGAVKPYSICGSLPLVRSMQRAGFDLQITGFGASDAYHAENEYCRLSDMLNACKILSLYCSKLQAFYKSKKESS